jgi:hypothetical protein
MLASEYNDNIVQFHNKIMGLPTSDLKYPLYLLLFSINKVNTEYTRSVLECALEFTDCYLDFLLNKNDPDEVILRLYYLNKRFEELANTAGTNTNIVLIKQAVLNIGGGIAGVACGVVGGVIGGISGFARGLWNQEALWEYSWTGTVIGLFIGAAIGFRSPKKLLKDPLFRQVKFALDGLEVAVDRTQNIEDFTQDDYNKQADQHLLTEYFDNDTSKLDEYLNSDEVEYEIGTFGAEFVSPRMAGSLGHHAFIRIPINGKYLGIEFTPSPSDYTKTPIQSELRKVSGKKILEMYGFHLSLQRTDSLTNKYLVTELKSGERDCKSYINKLLIGTSQEPTRIMRYHETDNTAGYAVRFFMEHLGAYPDNLRFSHETKTNAGLSY